MTLGLPLNNLGFMVISLVIGFLGLAAIFISLGLALDDWLRRNWSTTQGKVISHELVLSHSGYWDYNKVELYVPQFTYEYMVGGQSYRGTHHGGPIGVFRKSAQKRLEDYPEGSVVTINYNPNNPDLSILISKPQLVRNTFLIGVSLLVIALIIFTASIAT